MGETEESPEIVAVPEPALAPELEPELEPEPLAEAATEFDELDVAAPQVAIVVADASGLEVLGAAEHDLRDRGIRSETRVMSADADPQAIADYAENARMRGIQVMIAGAGPRARLPSLVAVHTRLPVIGVPLSSQGAVAGRLDALLLDIPPETEPVAWVGLDDALGAAALAVRILGS